MSFLIRWLQPAVEVIFGASVVCLCVIVIWVSVRGRKAG